MESDASCRCADCGSVSHAQAEAGRVHPALSGVLHNLISCVADILFLLHFVSQLYPEVYEGVRTVALRRLKEWGMTSW